MYLIGDNFWKFVTLPAEDAQQDFEYQRLCSAVAGNEAFVIHHPVRQTYDNINDLFEQLPSDLRAIGLTDRAVTLETFRTNAELFMVVDDLAGFVLTG